MPNAEERLPARRRRYADLLPELADKESFLRSVSRPRKPRERQKRETPVGMTD
jgi:hypothetical protein